jgi:hypothetical protein
MKRETFFKLCKWVEANNQVHLVRGTSITTKEQVAMFLWTINYSASNRVVQERFQHSGETVSRYVLYYYIRLIISTNIIRYFHRILVIILRLHQEIVTLPTINTPLSTAISNDPKRAQYFSDCLGALDGTHIDVHLPIAEQGRYRNRKGGLSQNVLAVCNFEMEFVYVLSGWEGSAHDGTVLRDAQYNQGFRTPLKKYWLGDPGYSNSDTVLVPYRSVRYHLRE